ncbi:MAG: hypothetical protein IPO08_08785 [Xanthomonadales bacterium]|nr:hypothetical protein [Xanthomonadales bacterium]
MSNESIDTLLDDLRGGGADATDRLFAVLYAEFHAKAHLLLRGGSRQTLCTTELVNETWMRLQGKKLQAETRVHFFNIASLAMRQVLIDRARARQADKRGDGLLPLTLGAASEVASDEPFDVLVVDRVMSNLNEVDSKLAEIAQLHLFGGLGFVEIAELLGSSERTIFRQWRTARMYLITMIREHN